MKASCSRADLARLLSAPGKDLLGSCAGLLGFEKAPALPPPGPVPPIGPRPPPPQPKREPPPPPAQTKDAYLRVVTVTHKDVEQVPVLQPPWQQSDRGDVLAFDPPDPLVPWPRLWRHLRRHLSVEKATAEVDQAALVERLSRAETIESLPRLQRACFAARPRVLVDASTRLLPFWHDQDLVCRHLARWTANDAAETFPLLEADPILPRLAAGWPDLPKQDFRGAMVLVLGDLGAYGGQRERDEWLQVAEQLSKQGAILRALVPCPFWRVDRKLAALWHAIPWEASERRCRPLVAAEREQRADKLLSLLSPALRIELGLLRRARSLLPPDETDSGTEVDALYHPAVSDRSAVALSLDPNHKRQLESKLDGLAKQEGGQAVARELRELVERWHGKLPPEIKDEEMFHLSRRLPELFDPGAPEHYRRFMESTLAAIDSSDAHGTLPAGVAAWFRDLERRISAELWKDEGLGRALRRAYAVVHRQDAIGKAPFLLGPEELQIMSRGQGLSPVRWRLWQVGRGVVARPALAERRPALGAAAVGSPVAEIVAASPRVLVEVSGAGATSYRLDMEAAPIPLPEAADTIVLKTDRQEIHLEAYERPGWAKRAGRDEYGLWAEFEYKGVAQRMRWIAPCRFMMGSPSDEPERRDDEVLHQVELTQGYWLADTACTQDLWVAVMGKNPSHFQEREKGKASRPVENVSREDCDELLRKLNKAAPGLDLRFPTEAEWENACRAGTTTPFSFGAAITQDQVNFGYERKQTVPVKSLPPNAWGLYEMHGNVWEWCEDLRVQYDTGLVIDPRRREGEGARVLRGGSWRFDARTARSADRLGFPPGIRYVYLGFRLARGRQGQQGKPAGAEGARGPAEAERSAAEVRAESDRSGAGKETAKKKGLIDRWFGKKEKKK